METQQQNNSEALASVNGLEVVVREPAELASAQRQATSDQTASYSVGESHLCGIGGGGGSMLANCLLHPESTFGQWPGFALDLNPTSLKEATDTLSPQGINIQTFHIGGQEITGSGCKPEFAKATFEKHVQDDPELKRRLEKIKVLVTFVTLGKGTGTGILVPFAKLAKECRVSMRIWVVAMPALRGREATPAHRALAKKVLAEMAALGETVYLVENENMYTREEIKHLPIPQGRAILNTAVVQTVNGALADFIAKPKNADAPDIIGHILEGPGMLLLVCGRVNLSLREEEFRIAATAEWEKKADESFCAIGPQAKNAWLTTRGPWSPDQLNIQKGLITHHTQEMSKQLAIEEHTRRKDEKYRPRLVPKGTVSKHFRIIEDFRELPPTTEIPEEQVASSEKPKPQWGYFVAVVKTSVPIESSIKRQKDVRYFSDREIAFLAGDPLPEQPEPLARSSEPRVGKPKAVGSNQKSHEGRRTKGWINLFWPKNLSVPRPNSYYDKLSSFLGRALAAMELDNYEAVEVRLLQDKVNAEVYQNIPFMEEAGKDEDHYAKRDQIFLLEFSRKKVEFGQAIMENLDLILKVAQKLPTHKFFEPWQEWFRSGLGEYLRQEGITLRRYADVGRVELSKWTFSQMNPPKTPKGEPGKIPDWLQKFIDFHRTKGDEQAALDEIMSVALLRELFGKSEQGQEFFEEFMEPVYVKRRKRFELWRQKQYAKPGHWLDYWREQKQAKRQRVAAAKAEAAARNSEPKVPAASEGSVTPWGLMMERFSKKAGNSNGAVISVVPTETIAADPQVSLSNGHVPQDTSSNNAGVAVQ